MSGSAVPNSQAEDGRCWRGEKAVAITARKEFHRAVSLALIGLETEWQLTVAFSQSSLGCEFSVGRRFEGLVRFRVARRDQDRAGVTRQSGQAGDAREQQP